MGGLKTPLSTSSYFDLQVLAGLAQLLTSMWSHATAVDSWFPLLLETMLLLSAHPSLTLVHAANTVWLAILRHEQASKLPHVLAVLPQCLQAFAPKIPKVQSRSINTPHLT